MRYISNGYAIICGQFAVFRWKQREDANWFWLKWSCIIVIFVVMTATAIAITLSSKLHLVYQREKECERRAATERESVRGKICIFLCGHNQLISFQIILTCAEVKCCCCHGCQCSFSCKPFIDVSMNGEEEEEAHSSIFCFSKCEYVCRSVVCFVLFCYAFFLLIFLLLYFSIQCWSDWISLCTFNFYIFNVIYTNFLLFSFYLYFVWIEAQKSLNSTLALSLRCALLLLKQIYIFIFIWKNENHHN